MSIQLDCPHLTPIDFMSRIEVSSGLESVRFENAASHVSQYEHGAFAAQAPWVALGETGTKGSRVVVEPPSKGHTLALVSISTSVADRLRRYKGQSPGIGTYTFERVEWLEIYNLVRLDLTEFSGWNFVSFDPKGSVFKVAGGGTRNTTVSEVTNARVGLHFDCWDNLPVARRHLGSNRISINLGQGVRYFQFIPYPASDLWSALVRTEPAAVLNEPVPNRLANAVMAAIPGLPVFRMAVHPGEAYIAPTENVIHDGAVAQSRDITLTLRGDLEPVGTKSCLQL